ncbi:MAG: hypothetical protein ACYCT1_08100 [Steroidobacteraceae bacterium]
MVSVEELLKRNPAAAGPLIAQHPELADELAKGTPATAAPAQVEPVQEPPAQVAPAPIEEPDPGPRRAGPGARAGQAVDRAIAAVLNWIAPPATAGAGPARQRRQAWLPWAVTAGALVIGGGSLLMGIGFAKAGAVVDHAPAAAGTQIVCQVGTVAKMEPTEAACEAWVQQQTPPAAAPVTVTLAPAAAAAATASSTAVQPAAATSASTKPATSPSASASATSTAATDKSSAPKAIAAAPKPAAAPPATATPKTSTPAAPQVGTVSASCYTGCNGPITAAPAPSTAAVSGSTGTVSASCYTGCGGAVSASSPNPNAGLLPPAPHTSWVVNMAECAMKHSWGLDGCP